MKDAKAITMVSRLERSVLAVLLLLGLTLPAVTRAEASGPNLLSNAAFERRSASNVSTFRGTGPGPSVVGDWETFNLTSGTTTTELLPSAAPGRTLVHVTTDGWGNGLVNVFLPSGTGPLQSVSLVQVFVVRGQVGLGTGNGGETGFNAFSRTTGAWETLVGIHDGSPSNEFILYASSLDGAEFFVGSAIVLAVESNGAAPAAVSTLTSGNACNGLFSGTFKGDVTVSAGQTCVITDGTILGNVHQHGGNLVLAGTLILHDAHIDGGTFSLGPSMTINGNLQVQKLLPGSAFNKVCDAVIHGDLQVHDNGAAVQVGSQVPASCAGNVVHGNLQVHDNTGATQAIGNAVRKDLQCQNNRALRAGLNSAHSLQGQCAAP